MAALSQGLEFEFVHPDEASPVAFAAAPATRAAFRPHRKQRRRRAGRYWPRRAGARKALPLAIGLLSAVVFWALTDGGSLARRPAPIMPRLEQLLEQVGLGMSEIAVSGQQMVSDREIYARLGLSGARSIWTVDTEAARRRLEALPWIEKASLKRIFPDRLLVEIKEWRPFALWRDKTRAIALARSGRALGPVEASRFARLPVVFGARAARTAPAIIESVSHTPALAGRVALFERVAERRWTLHLKSGRRILLPVEGQANALLIATKGAAGRRLVDLDFETLDLRIPERPAITMRNGGGR